MKKPTRRERAAAHRSRSDKAEPREAPAKRERRGRAPSGNAILARNLVIIAGLILAIAFTWKRYQRTLAAREADRQLAAQQQTPPPPPALPVETPQDEPLANAEPAPPPELTQLPDPEPNPEPPAEPPAPPETLSPAQSLIRLRADLAAGKRDTMPLGTVRRGDSDFFLVPTPMTWAEASGFADAFGGHLPLASRPDDLGWLASQLAATAPTAPERSSLWVGGRIHGETWHSIDGVAMVSAPAGEGGFAALHADGTLHARSETGRHPFFIQWQRDGSNPASLRAVLARTKASLDTPAPSYPPGTLTDGERRMLIVPRAVTAADARELAEIAGGHLMVPATPNEAIWIAHDVTGAAFPKGLWLGATQNDAEWQWDTGEAWTFARWDPATPPGDGTALLFMPGAGWQAADPVVEASGFIIEWSRDSASPATATPPEGPAELLEKSRKLLESVDKERDKELAANARTFVFNLDVWLRTNNKGDIARWKPRLEALKARVIGNRVPANLPKRPNDEFSERMLKIARGCLDKQNLMDADFLIKAARVRDVHVARLLELAAAEEQRGQPRLARKLTATAEAAANLDDWLASLGPLAAE